MVMQLSASRLIAVTIGRTLDCDRGTGSLLMYQDFD